MTDWLEQRIRNVARFSYHFGAKDGVSKTNGWVSNEINVLMFVAFLWLCDATFANKSFFNKQSYGIPSCIIKTIK